MKVFHSLGCSDNNGVSFRLFQLFPAEKPGGFPSPESGTGCIGSSIALSEQPPRGQTGGIEHCALPKAAPEGHIRSGRGAFRFGPSDTLVEVRPSHIGRFLTVVRLPKRTFVPCVLRSAGCRVREWEWRHGSPTRTASHIKLMKEVWTLWKKHGFSASETGTQDKGVTRLS